MGRPKPEMHSWTVRWNGSGNEVILEQSHWQPGYTSLHQATPEAAVAAMMANIMPQIAALREKWINLNLEAQALQNMRTTLSVSETDDPHEHMTMPEGAIDVPLYGGEDAVFPNSQPVIDLTDDELEKIGDPQPWFATDEKIDRWEEENG